MSKKVEKINVGNSLICTVSKDSLDCLPVKKGLSFPCPREAKNNFEFGVISLKYKNSKKGTCTLKSAKIKLDAVKNVQEIGNSLALSLNKLGL